jgi:hypothetical protein
MITIGSTARLSAAVAALGINLALAGGLASLANHYDMQAAKGAGFATQAASAQCRPESAAPG